MYVICYNWYKYILMITVTTDNNHIYVITVISDKQWVCNITNDDSNSDCLKYTVQ